jgi:hypothetical protein
VDARRGAGGAVHPWCRVVTLSLNATIMTAAVIDSVVFDSLFRELTHLNAEGEVVALLGMTKKGAALRSTRPPSTISSM